MADKSSMTQNTQAQARKEKPLKAKTTFVALRIDFIKRANQQAKIRVSQRPNGQSINVTYIAEDSMLKDKLKVGDIILALNGRAVVDRRNIAGAVRKLDGEANFLVARPLAAGESPLVDASRNPRDFDPRGIADCPIEEVIAACHHAIDLEQFVLSQLRPLEHIPLQDVINEEQKPKSNSKKNARPPAPYIKLQDTSLLGVRKPTIARVSTRPRASRSAVSAEDVERFDRHKRRCQGCVPILREPPRPADVDEIGRRLPREKHVSFLLAVRETLYTIEAPPE